MATEKRLIDVNEAKRRIIAFATGCHSEVLTVDSIIMMLNQSDTVDAVEVVHGRWEETLVPGGYVQKASRMRKQCSVCGWTNACRYHYCPNCGAKMDGGDEDG